jgi:exodeoxyribonuclease V beta subunit
MSDTVTSLDPLTLPLQGSQLIEASAGTGKTFTIALLYVRLVLGHGQSHPDLSEGLMPPNLLVVTFTEAATKELRDRIRSRLTEAADLFAEDPAEADASESVRDPLLRLRNEYSTDQWPGCRRQLQLAAEWMDEAAVSTIHGWCNRMLGEHAFDSGSLFRLTLETDQTELLDEVVRDYWRTFFYPLMPDLMAEVLDHWSDPQILRKQVRFLLAHNERLPEVTDEPAQAARRAVAARTAKLAELKAPWVTWCDELEKLLTEAGQQTPKPIHGASRNTMHKCLDWLRAWAESDEPEPEKFSGSTRSKGYDNLTPEGFAAVWKGDNPPLHPAMEALQSLEAELQDMPSARSDILVHAAGWISERLEQEKQHRAEMGFDDLLVRLDEALAGEQGDHLAATIRRQFPVAMIDEFQDTDPVQYRIFDRVYRVASNDEATGLLMIGDPKQAIYAFRGADIYTYLAARRAVASRTHTLGTNFRSAEAMVSAVNRVFSHSDQALAEGAFLFRTDQGNPLPFHRVGAKGTAQQWCRDGQAQPSLTFWTLSDEKPVPRQASREAMAESCASEIVALLNAGRERQAGFAAPDATPAQTDPVRPGDIAVLVNKRTEADQIRRALGRRGVRSVYLSESNSVLQSPVAMEVLYWLRACAEPGQLSLIRTALATPGLGLGFRQLDELLNDENELDRQIRRFQQYQQIWQTQGVLPVLRQLLMDYGVPARLLAQEDGERLLTDILHIAELLQQESQQLDGEHALIHHYTDMLRDSDSQDEHRTMRLESDAGLVKVVTVHKSKGLEYPLVFLPFATEFREEKGGSFLKYHDSAGRLQIALEPDEQTVALADRERLGEDVRKLYVALTRARYATWVGCAAIADWHRSGLGYLLNSTPGMEADLVRALETLVSGEPHIAVTDLPVADEEVYVGDEPVPLGEAMKPSREARENWWIASYSAITYGAAAVPGEEFAPAADEPEQENLRDEQQPEAAELAGEAADAPWHRFPRGASAGTFLHELLEWCGNQGFARARAEPEALRRMLENRCASRNWQDYVPDLEDWMQRLIDARFALPGGGDCALTDLQVQIPELEFWFGSHQVDTRALDRLVSTYILPGRPRPAASGVTFNGMLKGFVDLVFEYQGRYYVMDYKSNVLGPDSRWYSRPQMEARILEKRYDLQYAIYLLALHRLLKARLPDYRYHAHMGGALYYFLRGVDASGAGVFADLPDERMIDGMDQLFRARTGEAA